MSTLNETPSSNRIHIAFLGLRNAGKSTLVNKFCEQEVAIVSDIPGTTTDPVSKAIEIPFLGPCVVIDTAGLDDDEGELGALRVKRSLDVLSKTDIVVWVGEGLENWRGRIAVPIIEYKRDDSVEELRKRISAVRIEREIGLLEGLAFSGDKVVLVCPIDSSAPKGRLILPQVQVLRECLDNHIIAMVCQPEELSRIVCDATLVITDAQAYSKVRKVLEEVNSNIRVISFSELFARQKGDLDEYRKGLEAIFNLKEGDKVLVAEGCTHHRQCDDIGSVKIPRALEKLSGVKLQFVFASGADFPIDKDAFKLAVHCGGCMLTARTVKSRIAKAKEASVPIVNYGMVLSTAATKA